MSSVSSHYPIMLSLSLVCLYATFTSIGNINTVYLSCCLQGKIYAKMWVSLTMSSIRCVHPQYFRSYGATPIKGDSESFRPYYRLVIILDTLMSSVITLLHPVTLTLVGRRIFIVNSCQNFTYPGYSKVARGLCIKRHWIIARKWFNISFYNFGRSMLIQSFEELS